MAEGPSLAEGEEGGSEAQRGVAAEEIRPCSAVVGLESETIRPKGEGLASVGSVVRFGDSRETTARKGGDFWSVGGGAYPPRLNDLVPGQKGMVYYLCGMDPHTPLAGVECSLTGLTIGRAAFLLSEHLGKAPKRRVGTPLLAYPLFFWLRRVQELAAQTPDRQVIPVAGQHPIGLAGRQPLTQSDN